jgi:hypothetical protein
MRPRKAAPPRQYGDPAQTPFVRFDSVPIYPENNIYDCSAQLLAARRGGVADPFSDVVRRGPLGGTFGILPECTWFALIKSFFDYAV